MRDGSHHRPGSGGDLEFERHRDRLFGIAYRMTGSVADAEDACQEAWIRWSSVDPTAIENPEAFLVSITTRLCIDRARSAAVRRETYVGPYVSDPLVERHEPVAAATVLSTPETSAELADSLTLAFLVVLDQLAPAERAVFLLHDVFGYPFDEVAAAVDRSTDAVRQLASRARRKVDSGRVDLRSRHADDDRVIAGLLSAIAAGDVEATMTFLAPDIVQLDDGGALVRAGRRPIVGPHRVARLWVNLAKRVRPGQRFDVATVNGLPGLVFADDTGVFMVVELGIGPDGLVRRISTQLNPDKLQHLRRANQGFP